MMRFTTIPQLTGCGCPKGSFTGGYGAAIAAMDAAAGAAVDTAMDAAMDAAIHMAMRQVGKIDQSALAGPVDNPLGVQLKIQFTEEPIPASGRYRCRHTVPQQD